MNNQIYVAIGEEATRGTAESSTVGFVPVLNGSMPEMQYNDKKREEFRGEEVVLGATTLRRMDEKWSYTLELPFYTEGGTVKGAIALLLKHFFGKVASGQNGVTGQHYHMFYPVADPFAAANLGDKALTINYNVNEGSTVKNHAFKGGRVKSLSFVQETGGQLKMVAELVGQSKVASGTAIASPVFPAENLRCDYNNLELYVGAGPTRTGSGPNYTNLTPPVSGRVGPDKFSLKIENGIEDGLRLNGKKYPDKTRMGSYKASLEFTIDLEAPGSGFSSWAEYKAWLDTGLSQTNIFCYWNTGTQAGTGDNHGLYIDVPLAYKLGGTPEFSLTKDPMITLKYEADYNPLTIFYKIGLMLKNTAASI